MTPDPLSDLASATNMAREFSSPETTWAAERVRPALGGRDYAAVLRLNARAVVGVAFNDGAMFALLQVDNVRREGCFSLTCDVMPTIERFIRLAAREMPEEQRAAIAPLLSAR